MTPKQTQGIEFIIIDPTPDPEEAADAASRACTELNFREAGEGETYENGRGYGAHDRWSRGEFSWRVFEQGEEGWQSWSGCVTRGELSGGN